MNVKKKTLQELLKKDITFLTETCLHILQLLEYHDIF